MGCNNSLIMPGGIALVTSTTRPVGADRYTGQWIEELDTGRVLRFDGTGWIIMYEPVQTFGTPASWLTGGVTIGNGTGAMTYQRRGGKCKFEAPFLFGTTSAVTGVVTLTLPVSGPVNAGQLNVGMIASGGGAGQVGMSGSGTGSCVLLCHNAASTYLTFANLGVGIPFVWTGGGQVLNIFGEYQMTSIYS